jgi:hypothetical protein
VDELDGDLCRSPRFRRLIEFTASLFLGGPVYLNTALYFLVKTPLVIRLLAFHLTNTGIPRANAYAFGWTANFGGFGRIAVCLRI